MWSNTTPFHRAKTIEENIEKRYILAKSVNPLSVSDATLIRTGLVSFSPWCNIMQMHIAYLYYLLFLNNDEILRLVILFAVALS